MNLGLILITILHYLKDPYTKMKPRLVAGDRNSMCVCMGKCARVWEGGDTCINLYFLVFAFNSKKVCIPRFVMLLLFCLLKKI